MPTPSAMARAEVYQTAGAFPAEFGSAADLEMWLRCARTSRIGLLERHFSAIVTPALVKASPINFAGPNRKTSLPSWTTK